MLYESDFAYFLRDPAPRSDATKRPYISIGQNKKYNNFLESKDVEKVPKHQTSDNKCVVINVNDCLKEIEKRKNFKNVFLQPPMVATNDVKKDYETAAIKRAAIKWTTKTSANKSLVKLFERYCENTTVHGMKYFAQKNQHWSERIIWIILVTLAMIGVIYVSLLLSQRFKSTPLATVVESTIYPVADIAYPAVTICNYNRVNWNRVDQAKQKYLPNASEVTKKNFEDYLKVVNRLEFGSFDEFEGIDNWNIEELEHIDLFELYEDVAYRCEDIFDSTATCWWRNKFYNCCSLFFEQRSEYGLCLSFNSVTTAEGFKEFENTQYYPLRTSSAMDWSGLHFEITLPKNGTPPSLKSENSGLMVIVGNPWEWPSYGYLVPAGTNTGVSVRPTYSYATDNINDLEIQERMCIFDEEIHTKINNEAVMRLPLPFDRYYIGNCYSECRQQHMIKFCNCTIDYFYPTGNYTRCRMSGVKCLNKYDEVMNYRKPPSGNAFFKDDEPGITCNCWQECTRTEYAVEVAPNMLSESDPGKIILDVHYQKETIVKYRTDVVFGWMDLMVGFGGIAGLFLGSSLLSGVECLYYLAIGFGLLMHKFNLFKLLHFNWARNKKNKF